jgi:hypothetical protein
MKIAGVIQARGAVNTLLIVEVGGADLNYQQNA